MFSYKILIPMILSVIMLAFIFKDKSYDDKVIKLGLSLPQSGIMRAWGDGVYAGANTYFSYANDKHLLSKKIELITYDDQYEPELTYDNVRKLIQKNVFAFFGFVGTPTAKKIMPLLEESDIPFIAPFSGADFLRTRPYKNIINFRSSYQEEVENIVQYLYTKKNIRRFAVFYQNDDYGEAGYIALLKALKKRGLLLHGEGTYKRNTLSIKHAFYELKNRHPQAILMIGAYKANTLFIQTAKQDDSFTQTIFCNISFGNADEIVKALDHHASNILFSEVVPNYKNSIAPVIMEYKELMHQYAPEQPLGFISLESFLAAKTVVSALQSIQGTLTKDSFIKMMKTLPRNTLEGIDLHFKNNQLHNKTYLFKYENTHFLEVPNEY